MSGDELWRAVDELLQLIDGPESIEHQDLACLVRLLDRVAAAAPEVDGAAAPRSEREPPNRDPAEMRERLSRRFPDIGFYWTCSHATCDRDRDELVADAIDDLLDIAGDLLDARWMRDHGEAGDGERTLQQLRFHWMRHVRDLQSHLHWRVHEAD